MELNSVSRGALVSGSGALHSAISPEGLTDGHRGQIRRHAVGTRHDVLSQYASARELSRKSRRQSSRDPATCRQCLRVRFTGVARDAAGSGRPRLSNSFRLAWKRTASAMASLLMGKAPGIFCGIFAEATMGQLGFFDADKRLQALSARGDPLGAGKSRLLARRLRERLIRAT